MNDPLDDLATELAAGISDDDPAVRQIRAHEIRKEIERIERREAVAEELRQIHAHPRCGRFRMRFWGCPMGYCASVTLRDLRRSYERKAAMRRWFR